MTMVILMIKSRFLHVGVDNTEQFEPVRLSMVANKISTHIDLKKPKDPESFYIDKERMIMVHGISLKIYLNQESYKAVKSGTPILPEDAWKWF